jgi:mRNA-degrading endonuclease RelE of RelBE toxin-antitoxin system
MNYNVFAITPFERQLKRLCRKYPSLKKEYKKLESLLENID